MATLSTALHENASLEVSVAAPCDPHSPLWLTIPTSLTRVCAPNMEITIPTSLTRVCAADHGTLYGNSNCAPSWYPPQRLVLDRNPLGGAVMSTGLHGCQALISLSLRSCQIGPRGAAAFAAALAPNTTLVRLAISVNLIGDEGASAIGQGLRVNVSASAINDAMKSPISAALVESATECH